MKKSLLWLLIMLLAVSMVATFSLAGCKKEEAAAVEEEEVAPAEEAPAEEEAEGTGVVRVLLEDTPWHRNIENTVGDFEASSGIKVELEFMPEVQEREKMDLDLTMESGLYDVYLGDEMYIQKFAKIGKLYPLDELIKNSGFNLDDFPQLALETHTHRDKLYAIPWRCAVNTLAYRKDLIEKYGVEVPTTYDELMNAASKVQEGLRADGIEDVYGFLARGVRGEGLNIYIIGSNFFPSWGGRWFDETGKPTINSPEMVAALDYYATILQKAGSPDAAAHSWDDCSRLYQEGKGAFYIDSIILHMMAIQNGDFVGENTGIAMIPKGPDGEYHPGTYCPAYVISKQAEDPDAAWKFIQFATSYEQMLSDAIDAGNYEIANLAVIRSNEFQEAYPYNQLNEVFLESLKYAKEERPMILRWPEVGDIVGVVAQRAITGEIDAQAALDEAQVRVMDIYQEDPEGLK